MKLGQMIVDTEVLVVHPCDKLVESKCPGWSKCPGDTRRISYTTGKFSKARYVGLVHHFALSEEQVAGNNEATSLEDSFASCGCHNDHGALTGMVKAMFMDSTGAVVLSPDPFFLML
ncbi:hypothetical protein PR003_g16897 [Phytophthora rubi]|uniref:Uncharacterized protein n=2 Tax=Phytophthora rubi TaxID=129364 RepID=A0A6A4ESW0_9STRA|nr:hypothetical protein PR003_g16897 [Phytophthora rubi]